MKKKRLTKGKMARQIVCYCLVILTITLIWAIVMKTTNSYIDLSDILTFTSVVFGGELLMCVIKRIFAKPNEDNNDYS